MSEEPVDPAMQARLAALIAQLVGDLRRKNQDPKRGRVDPLPEPIPEAPKPMPVLSDEAKAIFKEATNPPKTLDDVKECLR